MALMQCGECSNNVSTTAKSCPHCGAKVKKPKSKEPTSTLLKALLICAIFGTVAILFQGASDRREAAAIEAKRVASLTPEQRAAEDAARVKAASEAATRKAAEDKVTAEAEAKRKEVGMMEATCQIEAERRAKDPSSVQWIREDRRFGFTNKEKTKATSLQPMRANNSYGGKTISAVRCDFAKKKGEWSMVQISEVS